MAHEKAQIIERVCNTISDGALQAAARIIRSEYPNEPPVDATNDQQQFPAVRPVEIFARDRFIDRYSGQRLVFPGALRLISTRLPDAFPYHPNWKMDACHFAYYELFPVLDHVVPQARGGHPRDPANIVTTSTVRNSAKAAFMLEELGWSKVDEDYVQAHGWDGLMTWFYRETIRDQSLLDDSMIGRWHAAGWQFRDRFAP
jgi:hypothetical protein